MWADLLERRDLPPTPFLLVDTAAMERNIATAAELASPVRLRPHFKAHKCTRVLERQLNGGACCGVTCATAAEALVLAEAGFADILVANEIVHPHALGLLAAAAREATVTVAVDSAAHVDRLDRLSVEHDCELGVLLDLDVGMGRCGMAPGSFEVVDLARRVRSADRLRLDGLMGYDGHAQHRELGERADITSATARTLRQERNRLAEAGCPVNTISGAGTGTLELAAEAAVLTELQAGSYVLMDADYGRLGLPFESALFCLATVVSRHGRRAVVDAGLKALSCEDGLPAPVDAELEVVGVSDEHTTLRIDDDANLGVGDTIALVPRHIDPTINLHPALFALAPDDAVERWPVDGARTARR